MKPIARRTRGGRAKNTQPFGKVFASRQCMSIPRYLLAPPRSNRDFMGSAPTLQAWAVRAVRPSERSTKPQQRFAFLECHSNLKLSGSYGRRVMGGKRTKNASSMSCFLGVAPFIDRANSSIFPSQSSNASSWNWLIWNKQ